MSTITLTFGDQAENHVGMRKIGQLAPEGFTVDELVAVASRLGGEVHPLPCPVPATPAALLILRNGVNTIFQSATAADAMYQEHAALDYDKKVYMYGGVKNKHARWNLCFDDTAHEPDYEAKQGRIIAYDQVPWLNALRQYWPSVCGPKAADLKVESNFYYDITKCGIGFHGDSERRKVIGVRLGATLPLEFQWFAPEPVGPRIRFDLNHGDVYIMSEKAVGTDWKTRGANGPTLRHAAGAAKYLRL